MGASSPIITVIIHPQISLSASVQGELIKNLYKKKLVSNPGINGATIMTTGVKNGCWKVSEFNKNISQALAIQFSNTQWLKIQSVLFICEFAYVWGAELLLSSY